MLTLPKIVERPATPYVGIASKVTMDGIPAMFDRCFPLMFEWMANRGITPAGAAFGKYNLIDMNGKLEIEVGVPVAEPVKGEGEVFGAVLPAGRYATIVHTGPYDQLIDVNAVLIGWAKECGIKWDAEDTPEGEWFACRLEIYETDPASEPDSSKWVTEVTVKVADNSGAAG